MRHAAFALLLLLASMAGVVSVVEAEPGRLQYTRQTYLEELGRLKHQADSQKRQGIPEAVIARRVFQARRGIEETYVTEAFSEALRDRARAANLARYGDPVGPTLSFLIKHKKTWASIIEAASHPGGVDYRQVYVDEVHGLARLADELAASGHTRVEIAREMVQRRRAIGKSFKKLMSPVERRRVFERNLARYGNKWGPTFKSLRAAHSLEEIIASASRTGGSDLGL